MKITAGLKIKESIFQRLCSEKAMEIQMIFITKIHIKQKIYI